MADRVPLLHRFGGGGPACIGTWAKLPTIESVEILAAAGFDFVVVDMEHAPLTLESAMRAIAVGQSNGMGVLVRTADRSEALVQRLLDAGADGLLVPRVTSADVCRAVVRAMRFPPAGDRGMGITSRAGGWGLMPVAAYVAAGEHVVRGVQIEDRESLRRVDELLDVDGLNALFVGLGDLALSTGLPADHPDNDVLVQHVLDRCIAHGVPCGTAVGNAAAARAAADRGFRFVMVSNDVTMLASAARDLRRAAAEGGPR